MFSPSFASVLQRALPYVAAYYLSYSFLFEFPQSEPLRHVSVSPSFCVSLFSRCFLVFFCTGRRAQLFCFRFSILPLSFGKAPFLISSGRVVDLAPGDKVQLLDPSEYRVLRMNATSQNGTLKKINAPEHRAFVRPASQIWVTPPLTSNMSVHVNEPTPNCLCSPPLPPPVLPDIIDVSVEATLESDEALDLLASEFCNVRKLQQGFEEARTAANNTFAVLEETVAEMRNKKKKSRNSKNDSKSSMKKILPSSQGP